MNSTDAMKSDTDTENWIPSPLPIPNHWIYADFEDAFDNIPLTGLKIPQKEYEKSGEYPVKGRNTPPIHPEKSLLRQAVTRRSEQRTRYRTV